MRFLLFFLSACLPLAAAEPELREHSLSDAKASVQLPAGWESKAEAPEEEGVSVYHLGKPADAGGAEVASMTLSVTTKVPERTEQKPSEYAAALLDIPLDDGSSAPVEKVALCGLPSLRAEYDFDGGAGKMRAVSVAIPNDRTGTLYFFAWQAPLDEPLEVESLREKVIASLKVDPEF